MAEEENKQFVNVQMADELVDKLDRMVEEDFIGNRSAFVRRLIAQEWARRHQQMPLPALQAAEA